MSQDVGDARKGLLDRSFQTLEKQIQIPCWNKNKCPKMKEFGPATDNARVPCHLLIREDFMDVTNSWNTKTPRDVFQHNNPDTKLEENHSADTKKCLHIVLKCIACGAKLYTISARDTIESLHQDIQKLVVHDKLQPLKYDDVSKLKPALPDDAAKVCELTHRDTVNACVKKLQRPEVLESIRRSLAEGKLKEILKKKGDKAKEDYGDPKKTYIRIGLGFRDFGEFPSQPVLELWPRDYSSPIHQHGGCAGSVRVVHGKLACKFYESVLSEKPMTFRKGDCGLHELDPQPQEVLTLKAGDTTWLNRQSWFVHAVECSNDASIEPPDFTLSIHFYKSCTDEFAFVVDGAHGKKVKKAQPKNDLFWNWKNGNDSKDGLEKGHKHYLEHYEDEKGEKILVPDFEKEVISAGAQQDAAASGSTAALAQEDAAQAEADKAEAEKCGNNIIMAAQTGRLGAVRHLLRTVPGAVAKTDGDSGTTALHVAALLGHAEMCRVLLAAGAAVDARIRHGWTPLHFAALSGRVEVVKLLLAAKASVTVEDEDGQTPLDQARDKGHQEVVTILENVA